MINYDRNKQGEYLAKVLWYYGLLPTVENSQQKIVCPFHQDIRPSMSIDLIEGKYFCYAEQDKGDAIKFIKRMENEVLKHNLNDLQILQKLFKILKSKKAKEVKLPHYTKVNRKTNKEAYYIALDYYTGLNKINWCEHSDSQDINICKDYMVQRGFNPKTLNLTKAKYSYSRNYPIIFPMLDNGKFKGWVCRAIDPKVAQFRKYLYNTGFSRRNTLVGDYGSKDYIYIVEGYMDRLRMVQNGETNVVAILGWKITNEQIQKLKKAGIKKVISALDNDECGRKGTEYLKNFFVVTRFSYLKKIKDPGDMTKQQFQKMNNKTLRKFGGNKSNGINTRKNERTSKKIRSK